ncbi:hypothetical protein [uncultured Vibrio sp.]|uniref:hypothetical protein n=1 Tax=uncultured Vibrio sp. TaxID=114054 RepID=UPI0029C8C3D6|nr:hypothetical protein [uncultured Vibrio sp.]
MSLTYQLTSLIGAGFTPIIAQALLDQAGGGTNTHYIAMLFCVLCAVTGIGVYLSKETANVKRDPVSVHTKAKEAI